MKRLFLFLLLLVGLALPLQAQQPQSPKVVVSIKPIHSLTAAIMEGVGAPQLLIKGAGTPHGYSLRPSEARMLADADLVIWIGEGLETFLVRPLVNLGEKAQRLAIAEQLRSKMLTIREGGTWEGHHAHGHDAHDREEWDYHLWTSPLLTKEIVTLIAEQLMTVDPDHAATYAANAASLITKLDQLYHEVKNQLRPVTKVPYIVFHDAYQYFERDFGMNAVGSVTIDTERSPGVRRVQEVRSKISELGARAVFSEPQFQSRIVATVLEGTGAEAGVLDPLGANLAEGPQAYFSLIREMGSSILATLKE
ncbi:MAG: zinc ABC transporter substrate-binding protein [Desulfuromonadales bacterium]|nr:zinc ABC transporter substrate-binding protein [Desulfuromonadales bacterium]